MKNRGFTPLEKKSNLHSKKRTTSLTGFTLVEMMVSVAIFSISMTIALGALLSMSESDRKAQTLKSVINNLNFAVDSMSRAIRTGQAYHCDITQTSPPVTAARDCSSPATSIAFLSADNRTIYYCLGNGSTCSTTGTSILRSIDGVTFAAITSEEVLIKTLAIYVTGATVATQQPKVTLMIDASVLVSGTQVSSSTIQTTVTQRLYDQ